MILLDHLYAAHEAAVRDNENGIAEALGNLINSLGGPPPDDADASLPADEG